MSDNIKNNFATAPAFPIIEAAAYRGDLRVCSETGDQPPLTETECRAAAIKDGYLFWLYQVDARGAEPGRRRLKKLIPVFSEADYVIICEDKPDFLTTVYAVSGMSDQGNTVLIGNAGAAVLDWYAACGQGRDMDNEMLCISIVTAKKMTALQEYMAENFVDALMMLNPDFARKPDEFMVWNRETGRYDFDMERFEAGVCHD